MTDAAPVDRGRAAVAAVEEAAFGGTDADVPIDREVLHGQIADVVQGPWWQACGPPVIVTTPRRSTRSSTARSRSGEGGEPPGEPTPCDGAFVSSAERAEPAKHDLDAASGWAYPPRPLAPVEIRLAETQLTVATVAHELGHALAGVAHGHGAVFRAAHIDVVALLCGAEVSQRLAEAYTAFELAVGTRAWPPPWRADGDAFRIIV